jgi:hypothetical protein
MSVSYLLLWKLQMEQTTVDLNLTVTSSSMNEELVWSGLGGLVLARSSSLAVWVALKMFSLIELAIEIRFLV